MINLDDIPVYEHFQYCVSRNTERVFLYDKVGLPVFYFLLLKEIYFEKYLTIVCSILNTGSFDKCNHSPQDLKKWFC